MLQVRGDFDFRKKPSGADHRSKLRPQDLHRHQLRESVRAFSSSYPHFAEATAAVNLEATVELVRARLYHSYCERVVDLLEIDQVAVVGHDSGGMIARHAIRFPRVADAVAPEA